MLICWSTTFVLTGISEQRFDVLTFVILKHSHDVDTYVFIRWIAVKLVAYIHDLLRMNYTLIQLSITVSRQQQALLLQQR